MSYLKVIGMGVVAGMRCMMAAAQVSHKLASEQPSPLADSRLEFLARRDVASGLGLLALGEMAADKLPGVPNRTSAGGLSGRIAVGVLAGAALAKRDGECPWSGAVLGAAAAVAGTFAAFHVRKYLAEECGIPDPILAVGEDALAGAAGKWILES